MFLEIRIEERKIRFEIDIEKPISQLVEIIQDPECTVKWLDGLRSIKHVSGEFLQPGSKSKVVFDSPVGRLLITETIIRNELPEQFIIRYDGQGYVSYSNYQFEKLSDESTRFVIKQDVELKGAFKFAGAFLRGKMTRQLKKSTASFKQFAENQ